MNTPKGGTAVMARRAEAWESLDCFPTPPWATRALIQHVLPALDVDLAGHGVWEPAAGLGHMVAPLQETGAAVYASDVYPYGDWLDLVTDFTASKWAEAATFRPDWVITNPPFNQAADFLEKASETARTGIAFLCRLALLEGGARHALFKRLTPSLVAVFSERVPMVKGRWDPNASTATAYAWFVWKRDDRDKPWRSSRGIPSFPTMLIPPGCKAALTRPDDIHLARRVAPGCEIPAPLLGGGA